MPVLITLARNTTPNELKSIAQSLNAKPDPWASKRLLAEKAPERIEGVSQVIPLDVFNEPTATLGDVVRLARTVLEKHGITEFDVRLKALGSVPFHAKAIRERLMKTKTLSKSLTNIIYIEAKPIGGSIEVRIGVIRNENAAASGVTLILEHPVTWHEAADFIRLGIALGVAIVIVTYDEARSNTAVAEAKEVVKGWKKASLVVSESMPDLSKAIGFSLWGTKSESALAKVKPPVTFVFGNEEQGLKLETKNACKMVIRLGPKSSEPLRSSQAAAYALGAMA